MPLQLGTLTPSKIYIGATEVTKAYLGATEVYSSALPWTPAELGASLALWLDADDAGTITLNGSTVSQWDDKSGNSRHALQPIAAEQPTYSATAFNGKPSLVWPSVTSQVRMDTSNTGFESQSWFFVTRYADGILPAWITAFHCIFSGGGATPFRGLGTNNVGTNTWLASEFNSGRYNGGADVTFDGNVGLPMPKTILEATRATGPKNAPLWRIGTDRHFPNRGWCGLMSEIIATPTTLSVAERQKLEGYLAWKWGLVANLPAGHPYKSNPPTV